MVKIEKKVMFNLNSASDEIRLPSLVEEGHVRAHILSLFKTLAEKGFGEFKLGTRGRGQSSRLIKNKNCPKEFALPLLEKRRSRRNGDRANGRLDALAKEINSGDLVKGKGVETGQGFEIKYSSQGEEECDGRVLAEFVADTDLENLASDLSVVISVVSNNLPKEELNGGKRRDLFKVVFC